MKNRVQSPVYEDSGVAISGELGEPSFSGECEGIVSLQAPKEIEENANPDPRFEYIKYCNKLLNDQDRSISSKINDIRNMFRIFIVFINL